MKSFLGEYGFAILSTIAVIVLILIISPVEQMVQQSLNGIVLNLEDVGTNGMSALGEDFFTVLEGSGEDSENVSGDIPESSIPSLHGAGRYLTDEEFCRQGVVLEDESGMHVLALSGTYMMWSKYVNGATGAELAELYPQSVKWVDASNIKDSSAESFQIGDLYYDSDSDTFYYVSIITLSDTQPDISSWVPLILY